MYEAHSWQTNVDKIIVNNSFKLPTTYGILWLLACNPELSESYVYLYINVYTIVWAFKLLCSFLLLIYLFLREKERERMHPWQQGSWGGAERERERIPSSGAGTPEPHEIMTWTEIKSLTLNHLTDWATQAPQTIVPLKIILNSLKSIRGKGKVLKCSYLPAGFTPILLLNLNSFNTCLQIDISCCLSGVKKHMLGVGVG